MGKDYNTKSAEIDSDIENGPFDEAKGEVGK